MRKEARGITLVALVVTIIILLILATISIQSLTHTGLFESANKAKLETKRSQISEYLGLKILEEKTNNYTENSEEIIKAMHEKISTENGKQELKNSASGIKDITIDEVTNEEDMETVDWYFYVIVDKDVYKVSLNDTKFIGQQGKFLPIIKIEDISNTSNSIRIKVKTSRNQGGKLEYYIKAEGDNEYKLKDIKTDDTMFVYENLEQGKKYSVKVIAKAENGQMAEVTSEQVTGTVIDLKEGDLEFTSEPNTWTNTDVKVTVKANVDIKGYQLLTSQNPENGWSKATSQTFKTNGTIYAVLFDGVNYGASASRTINNIDKTKPVVTGATATTNKITITSTDDASGIIGYAVTTSNTAPSSFTSVTNTKSLSVAPTGYKQGTTYYVWVKDEAGNISASKSTSTGKVTDLTTANVKFSYSPSGWTNTNVKATASTTVSGFTLQTSTDGTTYTNATSQTYSSNGKIYARLTDGTNVGASAVGNVTNIDKTKPTVSTALSSTSAGINSVSLSIGVTDANSGLGKVEWYYGTTNNPTTKAGTTSVTNLNESATGPTTAQTKTYTVSGLTAGTTYYFKAVVYDVAGNKVSSPIISAKTIVNSKEIGDEVTVGGEQFYVLNWDDNSDTVDLISKYNLKQAGTAQQNASYDYTSCVFSSTNYWSSSFTSSPFDLNYFGGYMDTDAIGKAKSYGKSKGAASSRLLSYEEANALKAKKDSNTKIDAMYRGTANTANGYLYYWLGSAYGPNYVWSVNGDIGILFSSSFSYSNYSGVRPVITILKSKIS